MNYLPFFIGNEDNFCSGVREAVADAMQAAQAVRMQRYNNVSATLSILSFLLSPLVGK